MRKRPGIFWMVIGGLTIGAAFFAEAIGLDNDPGWGKGRIGILILGMMSLGLAYYNYSERVQSSFKRAQSFVAGAGKHKNASGSLDPVWHYGLIIPSLLLVMLFYAWFVSSGRWKDWEGATNYYADLADGFLNGNLYLPIEPDPHLLALKNPYDPSTRTGVEAPADLSLYRGKFYMYWGPAPAVIPAIIRVFSGARTGDLVLALVFVCGIFLIESLLLLTIWDRYFPILPEWTLHLAILLCGLTGPLILLRHNYDNAKIYEAAIAAGQCFLLAGFFLALTAVTRHPISSSRLFAAGILWSLAIGSRHMLAAPIGSTVVLLGLLLIKEKMPAATRIWIYLSLGMPFLLGFGALSWYNWARFDSVTQNGLYYALADLNMQEHYHELFSLSYLGQNLYNYLFNRLELMQKFPFIFMLKGVETPVVPIYTVPEFYNAQPIAGLLYIFPFVIFGVIPLIALFRNLLKYRQVDKSSTNDDQQTFIWILLSIGGASMISFILLTAYFWVGMRFLGDFLPGLAIFCSIGFWQGYRFLEKKPSAKNLYALFGILLAGASIATNTLLAISTNSRLVNFLTRVFPVLR